MNAAMKILIAYDGSECADAALDDLRKAGLPPSGVEAQVISVAEVWLPPPPPSAYEVVEAAAASRTVADLQRGHSRQTQAVAEAEQLAARAAERLRRNFPGWMVGAEASYGSPAWEIIMKADRWEPDLVVVGSHGRNALGRLLLGSVSQKVLTEARASVRVARGRVEVEPSPARVIVAVDGSPGAEAAARAVAARQWPQGSAAKVIVVEDPLVPTLVGHLVPPVTDWVEESNQTEREWTRRMADEAAQQLRAAGLPATSVVVEGNPKVALIEEAAAWGADCIYVGSTGFGNRFERFLIGSVSAAVAARAHCSVEVIRARRSAEGGHQAMTKTG